MSENLPCTTSAILVLETVNGGIYGIEIGRWSSHLTCYRGALEDVVQRVNMTNLTDHMISQWSTATGMANMPKGARPELASRRAQETFADQRLLLETSQGDYHLVAISVARWVLTEAEVLNPVSRKSSHTAKVFVSHPAYGSPVPMTTLACWSCAGQVDITSDDFHVSRVASDARWGYEPCHKVCAEREEQERNAHHAWIAAGHTPATL